MERKREIYIDIYMYVLYMYVIGWLPGTQVMCWTWAWDDDLRQRPHDRAALSPYTLFSRLFTKSHNIEYMPATLSLGAFCSRSPSSFFYQFLPRRMNIYLCYTMIHITRTYVHWIQYKNVNTSSTMLIRMPLAGLTDLSRDNHQIWSCERKIEKTSQYDWHEIAMKSAHFPDFLTRVFLSVTCRLRYSFCGKILMSTDRWRIWYFQWSITHVTNDFLSNSISVWTLLNSFSLVIL